MVNCWSTSSQLVVNYSAWWFVTPSQKIWTNKPSQYWERCCNVQNRQLVMWSRNMAGIQWWLRKHQRRNCLPWLFRVGNLTISLVGSGLPQLLSSLNLEQTKHWSRLWLVLLGLAYEPSSTTGWCSPCIKKSLRTTHLSPRTATVVIMVIQPMGFPEKNAQETTQKMMGSNQPLKRGDFPGPNPMPTRLGSRSPEPYKAQLASGATGSGSCALSANQQPSLWTHAYVFLVWSECAYRYK